MTEIRSFSIPARPRSKNYQQSGGGVFYSGGGGTSGGPIDLSDYLLKSDFDDLFKVTASDDVKTLEVKANIFTELAISAFGKSDTQGGGGEGLIKRVYSISDFGRAFEDTSLDDTFNAYAVNSLHSRIYSLEIGSVLDINTVGTGNVITSFGKNGTLITARKDITAYHSGNSNSLGVNWYANILQARQLQVNQPYSSPDSKTTYFWNGMNVTETGYKQGQGAFLTNNRSNRVLRIDDSGMLTFGTWDSWDRLACMTDNVASSTKTGTSSMYLYAENGNEINFGGSTSSSIIYFGNRAKDSKPVISSFVFGYNGSASITCRNIDMQGDLYVSNNADIGFYLAVGERISTHRIAPYTEDDDLFIGDSSNTGWVRIQDACSADDAAFLNWHIYSGGSALFKTLEVNGDITASGWLRTIGDCGWRSKSYGGGIYMTDNLYVRIFGGKRFDVTNSSMDSVRTTGGYYRYGYGGSSWNSGQGALNIAVYDNSNQTPLLVCGRPEYDFNSSGSSRLFSIELLNTGSTVWFNFNSSHKFSFDSSGNFLATGGITAYSTSDIRLKCNLRPIGNAGFLLKSLGGVFEYDYSSEALKLNPNLPVHDYGLIAQNVNKVLPQYVSTIHNTEYLGIQYDKFIPLLIASQIEQMSEVEMLKKRVGELESKVNQLKDERYGQY